MRKIREDTKNQITNSRLFINTENMVVCPTDHSLQADIIFVIEATAVNGAYIADLKANYIIPSLE